MVLIHYSTQYKCNTTEKSVLYDMKEERRVRMFKNRELMRMVKEGGSNRRKEKN